MIQVHALQQRVVKLLQNSFGNIQYAVITRAFCSSILLTLMAVLPYTIYLTQRLSCTQFLSIYSLAYSFCTS